MNEKRKMTTAFENEQHQEQLRASTGGMNETEKAAQMIRERGYDRAIWQAQLQRRGATSETKRAHWDRVIEAMKAPADRSRLRFLG